MVEREATAEGGQTLQQVLPISYITSSSFQDKWGKKIITVRF